jgi:hypothetical protein
MAILYGPDAACKPIGVSLVSHQSLLDILAVIGTPDLLPATLKAMLAEIRRILRP